MGAGGNGASLTAAEPHAAEEHGFLLVTTDHVFSEGALEPLLASGSPGGARRPRTRSSAWAEGTRVEPARGACGRVLEGPRRPIASTAARSSSPLSVFDAQRSVQARGDATTSRAPSPSSPAVHPLKAVPLPPNAWWQDVDIRRGPEGGIDDRLRRSLTKEADGPVSRYLNRTHLDARASMALARLPIHPDVVSVVGVPVRARWAWALARTSAGLAGGLLVLASSILGRRGRRDRAAADPARAQRAPARTGSWTGWRRRRSIDRRASRCGRSDEGRSPRNASSSSRWRRRPARCSRWRPRTGSPRWPSRPPPERWIGFFLGAWDAPTARHGVRACSDDRSPPSLVMAVTRGRQPGGSSLIVLGMLASLDRLGLSRSYSSRNAERPPLVTKATTRTGELHMGNITVGRRRRRDEDPVRGGARGEGGGRSSAR